MPEFYRAGDQGWRPEIIRKPSDPSKQHNIITGSAPPLMVGIDTETTGLGDYDTPITYALAAYRKQKPAETKHFVVNARTFIQPDASWVNGWFTDDLERSYGGESLKSVLSERAA